MNTIFIFRRDYRIDDNPALLECIKHSIKNKTTIIPIFIFTEE